MLEFSKTILKSVSFDELLFRKELVKAIKWLKEDERLLLKVWCITTFGVQYQEAILDIFRSTASI